MIRVADSATWKSLGRSGDITKAQHCRAEFHDARFGWIPVDPADVRKVVLEEEKDVPLQVDDPRVDLARKTLFGRWEMNWMAFNTAGERASRRKRPGRSAISCVRMRKRLRACSTTTTHRTSSTG